MTADARLWHPWLCIQRLLRDMVGTRWTTDSWKRKPPAEDYSTGTDPERHQAPPALARDPKESLRRVLNHER